MHNSSRSCRLMPLLFACLLAGKGSAQCSTAWQIGPGFDPVSPAMEAGVNCLRALSSGEVIAGGFFLAAGGTVVNSVARWDGVAWRAMGSGVWDAAVTRPGFVRAVTALLNGDVVVAGEFTSAGGVAASNIARWDGTGWHALGTGFDGPVNALVTLDNGDLIAGGFFANAGGQAAANIARWDGVQWQPLGPGLDGEVTSLLRQTNGGLVVGGHFFSVIGSFISIFVARWSGSSWSDFGESLDWWGQSIYPGVYALAELPNGDIVVGGDDIKTVMGTTGITRWDGVRWRSLGQGANGVVYALSLLPNGDLVAGGWGSFGQVAGPVARWNGSAWAGFAPNPYSVVLALDGQADGSLCVGGNFASSVGLSSVGFARLRTTCPATAVAVPTTCVGPRGPVTLTADVLPWTGSTFRATATGFGATSLAVGMIGIGSPNTPLSQLHPAGIPGCSLLTNPVDWTLLVPNAGAASWLFSIPNDSIYAGVTLHHQMLQLEVDAAPSLLSLSSSNALMLTIGSF
jgi:trimeric autotransporter adhesin